jgi:L-cysteine/cystine lyase
MHVGLEWAVTRAGRLARSAADRLAAIPGVELVTPRHQMGTLITFRIAGWPCQRVFEELNHRVFAITRTIVALDAVRVSVGFFNTDDEIERFCGAVAELAAHTPETLPPRPSLTILGQGGE